MSDAQGNLMMKALTAVRQMHSDSSRMLRDLDTWMDGYKSVYGSVATMDLSYDVKKGLYMAEGLLRHYVRPEALTEVLAVNVAFFDFSANLTEPLLIVAKLVYASPLESVPDRANGWDPWSAYLGWNQDRIYGKVIDLEGAIKKEKLLKVAVAALPLFAITNQSVLQALVRQVQAHEFADRLIGQELLPS